MLKAVEELMPLIIPGYMTTEEAAVYLGVTPSRVRQLIQEKILPREKIGTSNLIPFESVQEYKRTRHNAGWQKGKPRKSS